MRLIDADAYCAEMKTRQDACKDEIDKAIAREDWELYDKISRAYAVFTEAKLTLDKMPTIAAPRWVRCEERLPEEKGWYLVYAPKYRGGSSSGKESANRVMFSKWSGKTWSIEVGYYERPNCVTHWMPLPQPSKEGE